MVGLIARQMSDRELNLFVAACDPLSAQGDGNGS
jgi:hypothetical protein